MLQNISAIGALDQANASKSTNLNEVQTPFSNYFTQAINKVNDYQLESDSMTQKLITGENVNLHDVMISAQKSSIVMQTAIEVRNKAVDAYQEMMRMSI